jgi:N-formylglutamate amidohydrolase
MGTIKNVTKMVPCVILHIPHSSRIIPPTARTSILLSDEELSRELLRMTDSFTDELFQVDPSVATPVVFPASRLVVDPERFLDDSLEPMAKAGMGAVYTRTSDGNILRMEGNTHERERLIAEYYHPHHRHLTNTVRAALDRWGTCLIIDCHSFASVPLPHELNQSPDRPQICVGTDEFHSPKSLETRAIELFEKAGFSTFLNQPFAGALVPMAFYRCDLRVRAIMIEVNRRLYMDEASGHRLPSFGAFGERLRGLLTKLLETAY